MTSVHKVPLSVVKREFKTLPNHSRPIFQIELSKNSPAPSKYNIESRIGSTNHIFKSPTKSFKNCNSHLNTVDIHREVQLARDLERLRGSRNQPNLSLTYDASVTLTKPRSKGV